MRDKLFFVLIFLFGGGVLQVQASSMDFGGELRLRPEYRGNPDFNNDTHEGNSFVGSRLRLTGRGQAAEDVSVKVTLQDTRNWGEEPGTASGLTDTGEAVDIHEGYVEFHQFLHTPLNLRAGRQELSFGDQRLIGSFGWSHQARAFDAFKFFIDNEVLAIEIFAAKRKENNGLTTSTAPLNLDRDLSGIYSSWKKILPKTTVDVYFFHDREGDTAISAKAKNVYTVGTRFAGKVSGVDYSAEIPFQFGDNGTVVGVSSDDVKISATALAAKLGYTFPGIKDVRLGFEYDFASGDDNSSDNKAKTFNNLYPTNHSYYGLMDNQGWRNMESWNMTLSGKPAPSFFALLSFWNFKLAEEKDGWYNAGGSSSGVLRAASPTNTKTNLGNEIDLVVRFAQSSAITWEVGYGHFFTGAFINNRVQNEKDSDWTYFMSTVKF